MSRVLTPAGVLIWLAVLLWSAFTLSEQAPLMAVLGASVAAAAPLVFVCGFRRWALVSPKDPHPVLVSVVSGFGAVLCMMAVTRFGEQYESHVIAAGLALLAWLVWVRWSWRALIGTASEN